MRKLSPICTASIRLLSCFLLIVALSGCVTTAHNQITELKRVDSRPPRILLMPIDVQLMELSAGGMTEPKADWTEAAHRYMTAALLQQNVEKSLQLVPFEDEKMPAEVRDELQQIIRLHGAVGNAVLLHEYTEPFHLPNKAGKFDWSLGPQVRRLRDATGADYALFLFVRDSYSSAGRVAVIAVAALFGVGVQGGVQVGFASLVDLDTGNVVWFNRLMRPHGDLRNVDGAQETTQALLVGLPK